ncbi:MAG: PAS domain S-box protein [Tepidiformaceae bacterium]
MRDLRMVAPEDYAHSNLRCQSQLPAKAGGARAMKVLVAEDEPVSALLLRRTIEAEGHEVTVATDGVEAWKLFGEDRPHLVVSDWMMPGMDGLELCRRIRAKGDNSTHNAFFMMLTARVEPGDRAAAVAAGTDYFLAKPLDRAELRARLHSIAQSVAAWEERRRLAKEAEAANERRYRETFDTLHEVYYRAQPKGEITLVSPSALRLTGYTSEELLGRPLLTLFPDRKEVFDMIAVLGEHATLNEFEAQLQRKDGSRFAVSLNVDTLRGADGAITGYQGTMRDIEARKTAEEERDRIFMSSVDMLCLLKADFTIKLANPAWCETLGHDPEHLAGHHFREFVVIEEGRQISEQPTYAVHEGNGLRNARALMRHVDGSTRWIDWNATPPSANGLTYAVGRDVTDAVRAEQAMQELVEALSASAQSLSEQAVELDRLRIEAEYLANHDVLTGVVNRRAWFAQAPSANPVAVAVFDIDFFKRVNDSYGHPVGDLVLCEVAKRLAHTLSDGAVVGRVGGEEFAAYFLGGFAAAKDLAELAVAEIAATPIVLPSGESLDITLSGGLAPWRVTGTREEALAATYDEADRALYAAKAAGRKRLKVYMRRAA